MISAAPTKQAFEQFVVKTTEPIYDTFKGEPVYIPSGYTVKIIGSSYNGTKPTWFKATTVQVVNGKTKLVKVNIPASQLELTHEQELAYCPYVAEQDSKLNAELATYSSTSNVEIPVVTSEPLVPRIYQEYGATFLIYKHAAILADAPGVGKTIQALVASMRVMEALRRNIDPLDLCYQNDLSNLHDEKNTHPTERPHWAEPIPNHTVNTHSFFGSKTTIKVAEKLRDGYWWAPNLKPVTVIVAPPHLCSMWYKAIRQQFPDEYVAMATGQGSSYQERIDALKPGCRFYIVNYEMMRGPKDPPKSAYITQKLDIGGGLTVDNKVLDPNWKRPPTYVEALEALDPVVVVFDESHRLKNHTSKQAKVCADFSRKIPYRFLLSATPIKREADDMFMQLHIVDPWTFPADHYSSFVEEYCFYKQTTYNKQNVVLKDSSKRRLWFNRIESLETLSYDSLPAFGAASSTTNKTNKKYAKNTSFTNPNINGYVLGRSYKDVGLYLPQVIPATIPVQMDANIRKVYENLKASYRATFEALGEEIEINSMIGLLHSLRILTACPNKYEAVKQLIEDNEGPFVIFCEYKPSGDFLAKFLETEFVSGDIKDPILREETCARLIREGKPVVGMGSVIGTGINVLADCNTAINFEADYTPGERTQRIGRVQRWSPNRKEDQPILLFDVMVTDSIDQHVYEVQKNRGKSIKDIIKVELGLS